MALGGGLDNIGNAYVTKCLIASNAATGGTAGAGGQAGDALGGGICNSGTIQIDALTFIFGNSPDDRFGC